MYVHWQCGHMKLISTAMIRCNALEQVMRGVLALLKLCTRYLLDIPSKGRCSNFSISSDEELVSLNVHSRVADRVNRGASAIISIDVSTPIATLVTDEMVVVSLANDKTAFTGLEAETDAFVIVTIQLGTVRVNLDL